MKSCIRFCLAASSSLGLLASAAHASDISLGAGGFVTVGPVYEGSEEFEVRGFPIIFPTFGDGSGESRLNFRGLDDIRFSALRYNGLQAGPLLGYRFGRDAGDAVELGGLGSIGSGIVVGGFAQYDFGGAFVDVAFSKQVSGQSDSGFLAKVGAGYDFDITDRLSSRIYAAGTYASEDYMDQYFSVTAAQSAASVAGYPVFNASAGFKNVGINGSLKFAATENLSLRARVGYSRIVGDAADSPISVSDDQFSGGLGLIYRF